MYLNPRALHWKSVITTTINHFTTMISVLPECPANQIFLSLLNTLRGVILTLSSGEQPGLKTLAREYLGHTGGGTCRPNCGPWGLSNPGCDLAPALPLGDLGQDCNWSLSAFTCPSVKPGIITQLEFRDFYRLTQ